MKLQQKLSIIIVVYHSWQRLDTCLTSLSLSLDHIENYEIIVINNDPDDPPKREFARGDVNLKLVTNEANYGFANGCNLGASLATGSMLLFLNPDTEDSDQGVQRLLDCKTKHQRSGILSCRQINTEGKPRRVFDNFPNAFNLLGPARAISRWLSPNSFPDSKRCESDYYPVDWVSGSVLLIDRNLFDEMQGWCEDFWMYSEDVDLCYRAREAGHEVAFTSSATIQHHHGSSSRKNLSTNVTTRTEVIISRHLFAHKHFGIIQRQIYHLLLFISRYLTLIPFALVGFFWKAAPYGFRLRKRMFRDLTRYYKKAFFGTWTSPRAKITEQTALTKKLH